MALSEEIFDTDTTANDGGKQETKPHSAMSRTPLHLYRAVSRFIYKRPVPFETTTRHSRDQRTAINKALDEALTSAVLKTVPASFFVD